MVTLLNRGAWARNDAISAWFATSRLDFTGPTIARLVAEKSPRLEILGEFQQAIARHMPDLVRLGMQAKALHEAA